ncbi:hypothetical protein NEOLI_003059 [Neolecta irregularis DAH-3]|uniref:Uncharacterized protein n=1 Tax=Neolecta irregularis (strain DAH-3) TaxID=1198029 RepID=A0A1U7LPN9_NEOID|nr:hypothetical protein NEOLI_003059 [Neolecta irregularis DAH-3]|eukprot:OLL24599.1 hypothetical protein NEOLI_003059 [Neolecta irregularis DAH-3]
MESSKSFRKSHAEPIEASYIDNYKSRALIVSSAMPKRSDSKSSRSPKRSGHKQVTLNCNVLDNNQFYKVTIRDTYVTDHYSRPTAWDIFAGTLEKMGGKILDDEKKIAAGKARATGHWSETKVTLSTCIV